ncbi:MAG: hypothetical protein ABIP48_00680 [Planctomycetota bacterium]
MFGIHPLSVYLLAVGLATLLMAVLVLQSPRSGKMVVVWLLSAVVGILLGSTLPLAACYLANYEITLGKIIPMPEGAMDEGAGAPPMEGMGGMPGMGGGMGMGGMGGGPSEPRPKRDLTNVVRKLSLLTGDVAIALSDEQAASLASCLADLEKAESMSDDDAQAKHDELLALLDDDQKARLDAIGLPRPPRGGAGGPGGGMGSPGGPGGMGGPGGPGQAEDANPFQEEANAEALGVLRERFAPGSPPAEGDAPSDSPPAEERQE